MTTIEELLSSERKKKGISLARAASDLLIKKENLEALENGDWRSLPEPAYVRGFITSYSNYLGLDSKFALALYRREFDEKTYPKKIKTPSGKKRLVITPRIFTTVTFILAIAIFIIYFLLQYLSILSAPNLEILTPQDDISINVPLVVIGGTTEKGATVAVDGEFIPVDQDGNFSYQKKLSEGKNIIEIIAAHRLSPKTKIIRTIRFTR